MEVGYTMNDYTKCVCARRHVPSCEIVHLIWCRRRLCQACSPGDEAKGKLVLSVCFVVTVVLVILLAYHHVRIKAYILKRCPFLEDMRKEITEFRVKGRFC